MNKTPFKIFEQALEITDSQYEEMTDKEDGIFYNYVPQLKRYHAHIDGVRKKDRPQQFTF